ncbi:hypothetical protein [Micromonospora siamensis]|uniref:Uncharacterized protein n=1 Tax=Micromonospora siamensis TaxID=299152 RepID=A0A1C5HS89_9ACTN|nr:hypothetical protein [Micromonospora siamensis]SCG48753.1 hypothetical protein GA0074704_2229 [Micromonospora siamensis]
MAAAQDPRHHDPLPDVPPSISLDGGVNLAVSEIADFLVSVRDDRGNSDNLRWWAQQQLDEIQDLRQAARRAAADDPDRSHRLARALRYSAAPRLSREAVSQVDHAIARAEADAERIYGDGDRGQAAA